MIVSDGREEVLMGVCVVELYNDIEFVNYVYHCKRV
jgi:hypothetical protein